jgi:hypothetical protein
VILSTAREPVDGLARPLASRLPQDACAARMLAAAPNDGQKFARPIGEPGTVRRNRGLVRAYDPAAMMLPEDVMRCS